MFRQWHSHIIDQILNVQTKWKVKLPKIFSGSKPRSKPAFFLLSGVFFLAAADFSNGGLLRRLRSVLPIKTEIETKKNRFKQTKMHWMEHEPILKERKKQFFIIENEIIWKFTIFFLFFLLFARIFEGIDQIRTVQIFFGFPCIVVGTVTIPF